MTAPFTYAAGTNGFVPVPFTVLSTELNSLANGNTALSSVGGSSGVFTQSDTGGAIWGIVSFVSGGAFTPASPNFLSGWFVTLADNTNYERVTSNATQARAPDFTIPLFASAYAANDLAMSQGGLVRLPSVSFKVLIWSQAGATMPSSGNVLKIGGFEVQY